jgi:Phosphotransferase system, mannose/fructose-specific component IIA
LIGLIIITHGNLAIELKSSLENIIGPQKNLETVCIGYDDDVDKRKEEVKDLITKVDSGEGVILLTEMFGNTPSNLLISLIEEK